jgi:putative FmdB family regulatory protein
MPRYEYRCRACGDTFEVQRPMSEANVKTACPAGHDDTVKLLSTIAVSGSALNAPRGAAQGPSGGGCCGGACGC